MANQSQRSSEFRKKLKALGVIGSIKQFARRALVFAPGGKAFRLILVVLATPRPTPDAMASSKHHTFRIATLSDLERLKQDPSSGLEDRDIAAFNDGALCLLQLDGDKLVGYTWVSNSQLIDIGWGFHVNLPDDMVYNYNGFTAPAYRGTAYQAVRHLKVLEHVSASGKSRLFGYVDHLNYKALRGGAKSGYRRVGVLRGIAQNGKTRFSLSVEDNSWSLATRAGPRHALLD